MAHWLVKSEPAKYSFEQLQKDGKTVWDGVRNNAAALRLQAPEIYQRDGDRRIPVAAFR